MYALLTTLVTPREIAAPRLSFSDFFSSVLPLGVFPPSLLPPSLLPPGVFPPSLFPPSLPLPEFPPSVGFGAGPSFPPSEFSDPPFASPISGAGASLFSSSAPEFPFPPWSAAGASLPLWSAAGAWPELLPVSSEPELLPEPSEPELSPGVTTGGAPSFPPSLPPSLSPPGVFPPSLSPPGVFPPSDGFGAAPSFPLSPPGVFPPSLSPLGVFPLCSFFFSSFFSVSDFEASVAASVTLEASASVSTFEFAFASRESPLFAKRTPVVST